ncbi:quinol:cytochrome C oxidoreductase [Cruoricaptor ignavus]|uniref:quinol:cytochrome C oxidoreductase n=1 Tax=Cruoricaptor ignavus TaxID=1118202 RepID=UPI00370D60A9
MYKFSPKLKSISLITLAAGLLLFLIGFFINRSYDAGHIEHMMEAVHQSGHTAPTHSSEMTGPQDHAAHLEHAKTQVGNQPLASLHFMAVFAFGTACCVLFFYCIQHAAHAGWSIIITRVMEAVSYFIPVAGAVLLIIMALNVTHIGHLFHWMDPELVNPESDHFDELIYEKSKFLNIPGYIIRNLIYVLGASFFAWKLRKQSKLVDETKSAVEYQNLYRWSVGYIVFFGFCSAAWGWDWLMTIDPHWYSTMYIWNAMVSNLATCMAVITLLCIYLKKTGALPEFNDNHLHDMAKYLFATSMLWAYTWFAQFMLYWYADIPEEVNYFKGRFDHYGVTYLPMLIINFLIPLMVMVSSSIKRNYAVVGAMAVIVIIGHIVDFFNMVMPGTVGPYWRDPAMILMVFGSILLFTGAFIFVVMNGLAKLKLIPTGNPYLHESIIYEYPF